MAFEELKDLYLSLYLRALYYIWIRNRDLLTRLQDFDNTRLIIKNIDPLVHLAISAATKLCAKFVIILKAKHDFRGLRVIVLLEL